MKLESLNLEKFNDSSLNENQLKFVNAGMGKALYDGMCTSGGTRLQTTVNGRTAICDYGYDSLRERGITYHAKSNCSF